MTKNLIIIRIMREVTFTTTLSQQSPNHNRHQGHHPHPHPHHHHQHHQHHQHHNHHHHHHNHHHHHHHHPHPHHHHHQDGAITPSPHHPITPSPHHIVAFAPIEGMPRPERKTQNCEPTNHETTGMSDMSILLPSQDPHPQIPDTRHPEHPCLNAKP